MLHRSITPRTAIAAGLLALAALVPIGAPAMAAAPKVTYRLSLDGDCFSGKGPASTRITFDLRKSTGKLLDTTTVKTNGSGAFSTCFPDVSVQSGTTLVARKKTTVLRTLTLPKLLVASNRATDAVTVTGPAGASLSVVSQDCNTSAAACGTLFTRTATIGANGKSTVDFTSSFDARGHDPIYATIKTGAKDQITRYNAFPFLVTDGDEAFYGRANPGTKVTITLKDAPGGSVLDSVTRVATAAGRYEGPAVLTPGRELSADFASDAKITIPVTSVAFDPGTHVLSGSCLADRIVFALWFDSTLHRVDAVADGTGAWSIDLDDTSTPSPASGAEIELACTLLSGDQVTSVLVLTY